MSVKYSHRLMSPECPVEFWHCCTRQGSLALSKLRVFSAFFCELINNLRLKLELI